MGPTKNLYRLSVQIISLNITLFKDWLLAYVTKRAIDKVLHRINIPKLTCGTNQISFYIMFVILHRHEGRTHHQPY